MRHVRVTCQNVERLSVFKNQIGNILKELNKFNENEKNEAMSYLKSCITSAATTVSDTERLKSKRKRRAVNGTRTILKQKSETKSKKCDKIKKMKYCSSNSVSFKNKIFKCVTCNTTTRTKRSMLKHVESHTGAPVSCIKCKRTFNGSISFNWHLKYFCKPTLMQKWKFKCSQCPRKFMSKRTLESHIQGHKRNNCSYCDKVLTRRVQLMRHLLEVHAIKLERDMYKCEYCEKRYIKKCSLYYHLRQHLPDKFICLECGCASDSIENHEEHKKLHDLKKHFSCARCDEKFSRRQQYLYHLKRHNQYKCVTCNEYYASRAKVTKHKQLGHQIEGLSPRFICPHCPVAYYREDRFHVHMRKHTEEHRTVNCKYCKKTFNSPYAYYKHCITVSHERYSPEINDIVCDQCEKHFSKRCHLKQHIHRVHNIVKQFIICQYCSYKTAHKSNMDRHVALHFKQNKQYTCEYCGKTCDSIASLNDHITYNHIQEKQFKCDKCDKCFKRNSELVRHQDSHSDERPHVCTLCGKSYKRLSHLKRHEQRSHQIVKESRRIKKIVFEPESQLETLPETTLRPELHPNTKIVFLQPILNEGKPSQLTDHEENVLINFSSNNITVSSTANIMDMNYFIPDRSWNVEGEDFYKIYNDVSLNDGRQSLTEIQEN